jgi:hypothetical protein
MAAQSAAASRSKKDFSPSQIHGGLFKDFGQASQQTLHAAHFIFFTRKSHIQLNMQLIN